MAITVPKALLHGMTRDHLRLNDPSCLATETAAHYTLTTPLTSCGTTARASKGAIVYSNRLMEIPVVEEQLVTRIRDIEIPFSCYYSDVGVASVVQMRMTSRKLVVSESQRANFSIAMEVFKGSSYTSRFVDDDFPVSVSIRKRIYFELSVETKDKLSVLAEECFATPTQDPNNAIRYEIIKDGWVLCAFYRLLCELFSTQDGFIGLLRCSGEFCRVDSRTQFRQSSGSCGKRVSV